MAIEKMKLVNIVGPLELFDPVARDCVVDSGFAPESVLEFTGGGGLSPFTVKNPSAALLSRVENLADQLEIPLGYHAFTAEQRDEEQISAFVEDLSQRYQKLLEQRRQWGAPLKTGRF